jgi:hypothetical protein
MRVCQPGPVAFHRANVSGDNLRLIATFDSGDLGRPRGFSMAAAARAPKILGKTSFAGRASAIILVVHSGLSGMAFFDFGRFFISLHLSFIGFAQTDDPRSSFARREHHAMQAALDVTKHAVAPFPIVSARVLPDQGRRPVELFGKVQRETAFCNVSVVSIGVFVHYLLYMRIYNKASLIDDRGSPWRGFERLD